MMKGFFLLMSIFAFLSGQPGLGVLFFAVWLFIPYKNLPRY